MIRQLTEARSAEQEFAALSERIEGHAKSADEARDRLDKANAGIAALQALAGAADVSGLEAAISHARRRNEAEAETIPATRPGSWRRVTASTSLGSAWRRPATIRIRPRSTWKRSGKRLGVLGGQREHWAAERTRVETVLDAMQQELDAATAAQDAHHALADARAAAERYARLHVARELLRSGIDRFRRSQQGPLLLAAGRHFATLTGNRYARLAVDEDKDGRMAMLAVRDDEVGVPGERVERGDGGSTLPGVARGDGGGPCGVGGAFALHRRRPAAFISTTRVAAQAIRLLTGLGRTAQVYPVLAP